MPRTHRTSTASSTRALAPVLSAALLAGALLAGCGGSGSPSATNGSPSATNAASREQAEEQGAEVKFQKWAKCLREHGLNAEVQSRPGGGHGLSISPGSAGAGPGAMEAAERACSRFRPQEHKGNISPQQKVETEEHLQRFAKCMREHGIKVEVNVSGGGAGIRVKVGRAGGGGPNPASPGFQRAQSTCQKLLPGGGPKGPPTTQRSGPGSGSETGAAEG
jgi:hypothetical protein